VAFRLKFSSRALREIGEAQEWYELKSSGLGMEFIAARRMGTCSEFDSARYHFAKTQVSK
jgi:hypothetical protein